MTHQTFEDYSRAASLTDGGSPAEFPFLAFDAIALSGENGEFCEKIKKIYRDKNGCFNSDDLIGLLNELGDKLWYINRAANAIATRLGRFPTRESGITQAQRAAIAGGNYGLQLIADMNVAKLASRAERGVLGGSGDGR